MEENNINIEEIMADIKREIKEKGLTGDMLSFEDVPYKKTPQAGGSVSEALDFLNSNYNVQPYKELKGNPLKVVFKKIIRKMMKFYIEPTVNDQNNVNSSIVTVLNGLADNSPEKALNKAETIELAQKELLIRIKKLEKENEELRKALGKQENV
ncbi:MAG TPA: hypothetical protein PLH98_06885 [Ruminococcus flavefaciens]|nr:hypothetical protein [Ruminococcus flavefaciens]